VRKQDQTAKTAEAPNADAAVKLADALQKGGVESTGSVSAKLAAQKYRSLLQAAVRRNYNLPDAYNFKSANLSVLLEMVVNARGEIASLEVKEASGDAVFDEMTVRAAQQSAPLPVDVALLMALVVVVAVGVREPVAVDVAVELPVLVAEDVAEAVASSEFHNRQVPSTERRSAVLGTAPSLIAAAPCASRRELGSISISTSAPASR
jgi:TonB family protein